MLSAIARAWSYRANKLRRSWVKRRYIAPVLDSVAQNAVILEIGGGYSPRYVKTRHPHVHHLDHCSADELRAKFASDPAVAHLVGNIQTVDFVSDGRPIEQLVPPGLRCDVIYGSHTLEHQVDLIGHLQSLEALLKPGARVIEVIPDLRTCFDALRYPTVTSDVLAVHLSPTPNHRGKQVFDSLSREIDKNLGRRMCWADWEGGRFSHGLAQAYEAMRAAGRADQVYRDTHAWTFTPESFSLLMVELRLLGLTRLEPVMVSPTYGNQFCAVLTRDDSPAPSSDATVQRLERQRWSLARSLRI